MSPRKNAHVNARRGRGDVAAEDVWIEHRQQSPQPAGFNGAAAMSPRKTLE
jgi:hypothetical protein